MRAQLLLTVMVLTVTTGAPSAYTRHHHRHHAHVPNVSHAQADPRVTKSMETLKATSVPKPDGSGRAVGTVLAGPALDSIKVGKSYYGEVPILGTPYITGYEPIMDNSGAQIGVYYVGYKK